MFHLELFIIGDVSESEILILLRPWATDPVGVANSAVKALTYFGLKEKDLVGVSVVGKYAYD